MRRLWIVTLIIVALVATACNTPTPTAAPTTEAPAADDPTATPVPASEGAEISVAGSTTVQPLAELFAEAYTAMNPNVKIDVQGGGSSTGVKSAGQGTVDVGMASREVKQSELDEYTDLKIYTVAFDGIALVVNADVAVDGLTMDQARDIFAGNITNWSEVGGPDANIVVVSREEGSGTRAAFEDLVLGDDVLIVDTAILQPSNGSVRTTVSTTPDSIGYLSFGYLDDSVKALQVDGVEATVANVLGGSYPVFRPLNMMTKGEPTDAVKAWLDYIMSEDGQTIVAEEGYIPVTGAGEEPEPEPTEEPSGAAGEISVAGSTTVQPLAELFAEAYTAMNPDVKIDVQGGGSSTGVKSAGQGTVDVGMASREVKQSELDEYTDLKVFVVAFDGIAIVVNPDVEVDGLTMDQARDIFSGNITNWSEVGGPDVNIVVVSREEGSGTRAAFEDLVLGDDVLIVDTAILQPSNGSVRTTVATTPDSIGYLSFGYLDDSTKALEIDGAAATVENVLGGSYPVFRPLNMMTKGEPTDVAKGWLDFIMSDEGQAIVVEEGYISSAGAGESSGGGDLSGEISVAGSTTVQPLAELFAEAFTAMNPDVKIDVQGGGSSTGVKSAGQGTVDVGMASREVKQSELDEYTDLKIYTVAFDGIALVVNTDVDVDGLTMDQARDIFAGNITNWSEVGGPDANIIVVSREEGSGTRAAFEELVLGDDALIVDTAILQPSNGSVRTTVSTTPDSIGYLSFGYLDDSVKTLQVDGVEATVENVVGGSYPVFRPLNMMTKGEPSELAKAWLDYIMGSDGQQIVADEGYIPVE